MEAKLCFVSQMIGRGLRTAFFQNENQSKKWYKLSILRLTQVKGNADFLSIEISEAFFDYHTGPKDIAVSL